MVAVTNILALETSGNSCSVALNCDGEIRQVLEKNARQHARLVLPMVDRLLKEAGLSLCQIDAISFSRGPGSFTGLRIGFGIVQGLAFGTGLPVIGISTLKCMAFKAAREFADGRAVVMPALDARMNEIYYGVYRTEGNQLPEVMLPDSVMAPEDASAAVPRSIDLAVGDGWSRMISDQLNIGKVVPDFSADAEHLAMMAYELYLNGSSEDVFATELSYIRNEISWKKREKIRSSQR